MRFTITKKIIASAVTACLCVAMGAAPALADEAVAPQSNIFKTYGYNFTISAGLGGFVQGGDLLETKTYTPKTSDSFVDLRVYLGEYVNDKYENVILPDEKYYVKGVRYAGHDFGDEGEAPIAFSIDAPGLQKDAQYVVSYGLKKDQVPYTVNYVDAAGNQIADSQTFYGNPGDKPVVAFRYIDGYLPTTYNLTGTLKKDAPNEFTFTYNAAPGVVYGEVVTETLVTPGGEAAGAAGAGVAAAGGVPAGAADVAAAAANGEIIGEDGTPLAAPEEIEDIDDDETPLAANPEGFSEDASDITPVLVGVGAVVLVAIAAAVVVILRKRQTKAGAKK